MLAATPRCLADGAADPLGEDLGIVADVPVVPAQVDDDVVVRVLLAAKDLAGCDGGGVGGVRLLVRKPAPLALGHDADRAIPLGHGAQGHRAGTRLPAHLLVKQTQMAHCADAQTPHHCCSVDLAGRLWERNRFIWSGHGQVHPDVGEVVLIYELQRVE